MKFPMIMKLMEGNTANQHTSNLAAPDTNVLVLPFGNSNAARIFPGIRKQPWWHF